MFYKLHILCQGTTAAWIRTSPIWSESLRLGSVLLTSPHGMELSQIVALHGLGGLELFFSQRSLLLPLEFFLPLSLLLSFPLTFSLSLTFSLPLQFLLPLSLPFSLSLLLPLCLPLPLFFTLTLTLSFALALPLPQLVLQLKSNNTDRERNRKRKRSAGSEMTIQNHDVLLTWSGYCSDHESEDTLPFGGLQS